MEVRDQVGVHEVYVCSGRLIRLDRVDDRHRVLVCRLDFDGLIAEGLFTLKVAPGSRGLFMHHGVNVSEVSDPGSIPVDEVGPASEVWDVL